MSCMHATLDGTDGEDKIVTVNHDTLLFGR